MSVVKESALSVSTGHPTYVQILSKCMNLSTLLQRLLLNPTQIKACVSDIYQQIRKSYCVKVVTLIRLTNSKHLLQQFCGEILIACKSAQVYLQKNT